MGVLSETSNFLAKDPSIPSINKAKPSHKKAPTKSLFKIEIIARNPKTAPEAVKPCTAQAAILSVLILLMFIFNYKNFYIY